MTTQLKSPLFLTKSLLVLLICVSSVFLIKGDNALRPVQSNTSNGKRINGKPIADKESASDRLTFRENGPAGRWSASIVPDPTRNSLTSPVVVIGNSTLIGNEHWRNLQLTHVTLKNNSSKTVLGVQLKWFVTTREDRTKVLPPPGYTGLFEAYLAPNGSAKVESPLVKFSQAVKHLVKNGGLEGDFLVQIRVYQVEFEDGTSWNEDWGGPKPGERGERWSPLFIPTSRYNHASASQAPLQAHAL